MLWHIDRMLEREHERERGRERAWERARERESRVCLFLMCGRNRVGIPMSHRWIKEALKRRNRGGRGLFLPLPTSCPGCFTHSLLHPATHILYTALRVADPETKPHSKVIPDWQTEIFQIFLCHIWMGCICLYYCVIYFELFTLRSCLCACVRFFVGLRVLVFVCGCLHALVCVWWR